MRTTRSAVGADNTDLQPSELQRRSEDDADGSIRVLLRAWPSLTVNEGLLALGPPAAKDFLVGWWRHRSAFDLLLASEPEWERWREYLTSGAVPVDFKFEV